MDGQWEKLILAPREAGKFLTFCLQFGRSRTSAQARTMSTWQNEIRERLLELRRAIRRYLVLEGLAVVGVLLIGWFWLTYLIDVGYFQTTRLELPKGFRTFAVVAGLAVVCGSAIAWLFTRVLRPLRLESLALLVENRFPVFNGRLMSALNSYVSDGKAGVWMAERNVQDAADRLKDVDVMDVLNPIPLRRWASGAAALIVSVAIFGATNADAMSRWSDAYLRGRTGYWDRFRQTELKLAVVRQPGDVEVEFVDGTAKHARGSHLTLIASVPEGREIPERVVLSVRSVSAKSQAIDQEVPMTPSGDGRFRHTVLRVAEDVELFLTGGDYTTARPYYVDVVDPPHIDSAVLECVFPEYTGMNTAVNQTVAVQSSLVELPFGTRFTLRAKSNKPVESVALAGPDAEESGIAVGQADGSPQWSFIGQVGATEASEGIVFQSGRPVEITLRDTDGLTSTSPIELTLVPKVDAPPIVAARASGFGSSVTRKARLPYAGALADDYALAEAWFEYGVVVREETIETSRQPLGVDVPGRKEVVLSEADTALDLRPLGLSVGEQIRLAVAASDTNDLTGPGVGRSDSSVLTIVSDEELLALLYDKEMNLRKRFEEILEEVTGTRNDIRLAQQKAKDGGDNETWNQISAAAEQAVLSVRKNETETRSIIVLFEDIRAELVNNRVDTADMLNRIDRGIVGPLTNVISKDYPAAETDLLSARERTRREVAFDEVVRPLGAAEASLSRLVLNLEAVLEEMQRRQSFNESIEALIRLIELQKKLKEKTAERSVDDFFGDGDLFE